MLNTAVDEWRRRWGNRTVVMGVLNVTPDSFSGDGIFGQPDRVVERARQMVADGADILDVGGESTRPGYRPVSDAEEMARVLPVLELLRRTIDVPISIDTSKAEVARRALGLGADMINDVSGLTDVRLANLVAEAGVYLVIVDHVRRAGSPARVEHIVRNLALKVETAQRAGVRADRLVVDPGFGFGKNWRDNFEIMRHLPELKSIGKPVLVGPSRKGMIGRVLASPVTDRLEGTIALTSICIAGGADVVRVHDVRAVVRAARMMDAIVRGDAPAG